MMHYKRQRRHGDANTVLPPSGNRQIDAGTVLVTTSGPKARLRLAKDLIPEELRDKPLDFIATVMPGAEKLLIIKVAPHVEGNSRQTDIAMLRGQPAIVLRGWYTRTKGAHSPMLSAVRLLGFAGMKAPRRPKLFKAVIAEDGVIEVKLS